eukprot:scaffold143022_cov28-Tisochrysis_lutea.AAC.1
MGGPGVVLLILISGCLGTIIPPRARTLSLSISHSIRLPGLSVARGSVRPCLRVVITSCNGPFWGVRWGFSSREEREERRRSPPHSSLFFSLSSLAHLGQVVVVEEMALVVAFLRRRADDDARVVGRDHASRAVQVGVVQVASGVPPRRA